MLAEEKARRNDDKSKTLGVYNEYSVPRVSKNSPLRTVFLDPEVNNFPKSKTRSELMQRIKKNGLPDISYDIVCPSILRYHGYPTLITVL